MPDQARANTAILLVDDEVIVLMSLEQELRRRLGESYEYVTARDASEALAVIRELSKLDVRVVLCITDWFMPGMKGDELITTIHHDYPMVRTILLSGMVEDDRLAELRSTGALDAYLAKPWAADRLAAICMEVLGSR